MADQMLLIRHRKKFYIFQCPSEAWSEHNEIEVSEALFVTDDLTEAIDQVSELNTDDLPISSHRLKDGSFVRVIEDNTGENNG